MTTLAHLGANSDGTHITASQNQKEVRSNALDDLIANALNDSVNIAANAGGTVTVSAEDFTENFLLVLTGDTGSPLEPPADFTLQIPATKRTFAVANLTAFSALVDPSGSPSTAVSVAAGQAIFLHSDGETVRSLGGGAGGSSSYDLPVFFNETPGDSSVVLGRITVGRAITIPAGMSGSFGNVGTNPSNGTYDIDVQDDGASIGTISITTAGAVSFATSGGTAKNIAAGSEITWHSPAVGSPSETIANSSFTILATED
jgi:hypothetical protein